MIESRHPPVASRVFARRIARIAFGVVLLAGMLALVAAAASDSFHGELSPGRSASQFLGYTWFAAAVAAAAAYAFAMALPLRLAPDALFVASLVVPAAGGALILPLTLHLLFAPTIGARSSEFDEWVRWSLVIAGVAHLVFAAACVVRVHRLATGDPGMTPGRIFGATVTAACLPFVVLCGIPPVLVAITGLPILPLLYGMKPLMIDHERDEIAALPAQLPRAALVRRRPNKTWNSPDISH